MDRLIAQGAATPAPAEQKIIYASVQKLFRDEMPYIPLFHTNISILYSKDLEGVTPAPDGSFRNLRLIRRRSPG